MKASSTRTKNKNTKKIAIISVIALVVLAGAFYLLWPQSDTNKSRLSSLFDKSEQVEPSTSVEPTISPTNSPTPTVTASELSIPAWSVTFSIPATIQDTQVKYTERKSKDQPPVTYYAFTTSRIQALADKCTIQPFGDTIILNRYSEKPPVVPDGELINSEAIGGYYYTLSSPIAYCSGFDAKGNMQTPSQVEVKDRQSLEELVKSIQAS